MKFEFVRKLGQRWRKSLRKISENVYTLRRVEYTGQRTECIQFNYEIVLDQQKMGGFNKSAILVPQFFKTQTFGPSH